MCLHHPDLLVKVHVGLLGGAACLTTLQITAGLRRLFYLISLNLWFSFCIVFSFFLYLLWSSSEVEWSQTKVKHIEYLSQQQIYSWFIYGLLNLLKKTRTGIFKEATTLANSLNHQYKHICPNLTVHWLTEPERRNVHLALSWRTRAVVNKNLSKRSLQGSEM